MLLYWLCSRCPNFFTRLELTKASCTILINLEDHFKRLKASLWLKSGCNKIPWLKFLLLYDIKQYSFQIAGFYLNRFLWQFAKEQKRETGVILKSRYYCNILNHKRAFGGINRNLKSNLLQTLGENCKKSTPPKNHPFIDGIGTCYWYH